MKPGGETELEGDKKKGGEVSERIVAKGCRVLLLLPRLHARRVCLRWDDDGVPRRSMATDVQTNDQT